MPELPAVEFTRQLIHEHCVGREVKEVRFLPSVPDALIMTDEAIAFLRSLAGRRVMDTGRWGKQLWIQFDCADAQSNNFLLIHLGMTGFMQVRGVERLHYESSPSNATSKSVDDWPPRFTKLALRLASPPDANEEEELIFADA